MAPPRLVDYLDKGASLGIDAPCLTMGETTRTYGEMQTFTHRFANALTAAGVGPGERVAILSPNDLVAFSCVFGISRAGAVWCPINPRNEAAENRQLLDSFGCVALFFHSSHAQLVDQIAAQLPHLRVVVCVDASASFAPSLDEWLSEADDSFHDASPAASEMVMLVGTGGTTGEPKGVMLSGRNLEAMTASTLIGYPFEGRPVYLALAPLTHAAGVLCFPVMALGGVVVVMPHPDLGEFLEHIERHRVTHTFMPPTLIYMLLDKPALATTDLSSLQCFWYGAAPMSVARLEEALEKVGPVMAQLFGQTEAPMMISMLPPAEHFHANGSVAIERLASAGRPSPLVTVAIMGADGTLVPRGERGEIVVRGSLVMLGYFQNPAASEESRRFGWHHTGDIGFLDDDGYLFIVDRAKDMIITGGFNVYSAEVEKALLQHPAVQDAAVVGLPDDKWGERVVAVVQLYPARIAEPDELIAFVKSQIGSVKTPKQLWIWHDLPRSKVGKVLKPDVRTALLASH